MQEYRVNRQIRAKEVRLIDENGKQIGIVPLQEALRIANEKGLDLVEIAPNANPPVCKILDYGKGRGNGHTPKEAGGSRRKRQIKL